jgi:hypothetical protein
MQYGAAKRPGVSPEQRPGPPAMVAKGRSPDRHQAPTTGAKCGLAQGTLGNAVEVAASPLQTPTLTTSQRIVVN